MARLNIIFSRNLKALIDQRGITQADFVAMTGTPQTTASMWMHGQKLPRPEALEKIAAFFGVMPADLFAEPSTPPVCYDTAIRDEIDTLVRIASALSENQRTRLLAYAEALRDMEK